MVVAVNINSNLSNWKLNQQKISGVSMRLKPIAFALVEGLNGVVAFTVIG